ncbi:cyanophycinase [Anoxynatronum buryatiense]|uniref:Cyanophycinase n=1 Tax=Anoxynatronum buryatiense TaxID=489973 RepID=A0AA46AKL5_9CLOT|nr:cyanophycinase [Anoxynatronum buryatiense]SMP72145.1 cyanophycinase [Anoxynatronum buryatiense]
MINYISSNRKPRVIPKGLLVAIGGNEDKEYELHILTTILSLVKKQKKHIEIITTASGYPEEAGKAYYRAFAKDDDHAVGVMHVSTREQATDVSLLQRITAADVIFFTGGDQLRITSILGGSPIEKEILRRYEEEMCIIAGTSAGASAMSKTMICGGDSRAALRKGTINVATGIGLIDNAIIDTHFVERGRFSRLMQIVSMNPGNTGIGLGEDAGIIIEGGCVLRAIGSGITVILDGQYQKYTNVADIGSSEAIAIENLVIHTIVSGYGYDLCQKKYLKAEDLKLLNPVESEENTHENTGNESDPRPQLL